MRLIKFIGMTGFLLNNLEQHLINFNNVFNFNDPFEGTFRYKTYTDYDEFKEFYLKHYSGRPELLNHYFKNPQEFETLLNRTNAWRWENNAVTCFSTAENECDVLMWSHYAKSEKGNCHEGICLVFETDELEFFPQTLVKDGVMVGSVSKPLKVTYTDNYLSSDPLTRELNSHTFLTTKFTPWSYEKEYRYIAPKSGRYFFKNKALKEVIFGVRLLEKDRSAVKAILDKNYDNVKISMIKIKTDHFAFKKIDYIETNPGK